ncbi:MAG: hypothetical protein JO189_27245 [Deltaproteobacteria bacterium]|nr:hypothetical protein [Deltaproteobacteria bacterium]
MTRQDLQPQQKGVFGQRKLDKEAVRAHVRDHPDAILRECAANLSHIEPDFANIKKRGLPLLSPTSSNLYGDYSERL